MRSAPLRIDWLPEYLTAPGRLGVTMAPGRKGKSLDRRRTYARDVVEDYATICRTAIVNRVLCLQERREGAYVGEGQEEARFCGITWTHFPIPDGGYPSDRGKLTRVLDDISAQLDKGMHVLVHCAAGLGRSGLVVGCWLRSQGVSADETLKLLLALRGPRCPETTEQIAIVQGWPNYPGYPWMVPERSR